MLWSADGASVIEFSQRLYIDLMAQLAHLCNHRYWAVSQLESGYFGQYKAAAESVEAVIRVLRHVINVQALGHLIHRDEL